MSSYRPRRTRIYGVNYDITEQYYKKQLDDIDSKRGFSSNADFYSDIRTKDEKFTPKVSFLDDDTELEKLKLYKIKPIVNSKSLLDDPFSDEFSKLNTKSYIPRPMLNTDVDPDIDTDNISKNILKKTRDVSKRVNLFNDLNIQDQDSSFLSRRQFKISTGNFKTSTDKNAVEEGATSRAKATKARLANLEIEMMNIVEKQTERQKRNYDLKKLLNESDR